jgi:hypothetical protein
MKNGKTTIFGALAAACGFLATQNGVLGIIGQIGTGLFTFLMGAAAKDATTKN